MNKSADVKWNYFVIFVAAFKAIGLFDKLIKIERENDKRTHSRNRISSILVTGH